MFLSTKLLVAVAALGLTLISSVTSYPEDYYEDMRYNSLQDDDSDIMGGEIYPDNSRMMYKRAYPRWHHSFVFRQNPTFRTSGIAEIKRFRPPFHPMARFRGISMHAGGGIPSAYKTREDFETLLSSLPIQPNPAHPVPSGKTIPKGGTTDSEELDDEQSDTQNQKINAGDMLRYLSSMSSNRDLYGGARPFRFGIK